MGPPRPGVSERAVPDAAAFAEEPSGRPAIHWPEPVEARRTSVPRFPECPEAAGTASMPAWDDALPTSPARAGGRPRDHAAAGRWPELPDEPDAPPAGGPRSTTLDRLARLEREQRGL